MPIASTQTADAVKQRTTPYQPHLEQVSRQLILVCAWSKVHFHFRGVPLWVFVRDLCGVGATSAIAICGECGWDPHSTHAGRLSIAPSEQTTT